MTDSPWLFSQDHDQVGRLLETETLWGESYCRVWLPHSDTVVRVPRERLQPAESAQPSASAVAFAVAAGRVADALTEDLLLAPIESSVLPLPHQLRALQRATAGDRARFLLADEVGLGKTIEAGLILRELKLRGRVRRALVIAPKGLASQWVAEMRTHFNEDFRLLIPSDFEGYRRIAGQANVWRSHPQVVCPMDSVKPVDGRRGWSREQVAAYNRDRFEDLVAAGWDLVIVDEAHRLGGSSDQVARFRLGQAIAEAVPHVLLLSATPHQGKTEAFQRLVSLLDAEAFPYPESVTRERVQPYVIRTEKRQAIDAESQPLFKPRRTTLAEVAWQAGHAEQRRLYEAVTEYVREGYNQAMQENRRHVGFLMILMQRLVTSSTQAIQTTLERRLEALAEPSGQLALFPSLTAEEWEEMDGEEQLETVLSTRSQGLKNERSEVEWLLDLAQRCQQAGPDAKAEALLDWIYRLQADEGDPDLKVLVFTEFVPTQRMLAEYLQARGISVVSLNGSMSMDERNRAQDTFAHDARVLVSTDAGGEGLNLQFCHVVVNYDMPWNPMRVEQRIGRVDRIGQPREVRAVNFVLQDSVEHRVQEVLEEKLRVILDELGVDKTSDVLDSAQAGAIFDDLYVDALLQPESVETQVQRSLERVREEAQQAREGQRMLEGDAPPEAHDAQRLMNHPMPHWVERMAVAYVRAHGGEARPTRHGWQLQWPGESASRRVVFTVQEAWEHPEAEHWSLEKPQLRGLAQDPPRFAPGQPVPRIGVPGLPQGVAGVWSLWQVRLRSPGWSRGRVFSLFLHEDGRRLAPTARHVWEKLLTEEWSLNGALDGAQSQVLFEQSQSAAETEGRRYYDELRESHRHHIDQERERIEYAFAARQRAIERIGLPEVRQHRLRLLGEEHERRLQEVKSQEAALPELIPIQIAQIERAHDE